MLHVKQGGLGRVEDGCAVAQAVSRRPLTAEARFGAGQSAWDLWWTKYFPWVFSTKNYTLLSKYGNMGFL
jgi:hypothetical protein